jgi:glycosyltransferase involved in cell wall biosynthesis
MLKNYNKLFFFFPYYHTGGSEKVHLQIVKCFSDFSPRVYFTDRSRDNKNKKEFYANARCMNFFGLNNKVKLVENILIFFLARKINRTSGAVVFGSNSRFFYSLIRKLRKEVKIIDLVHWLDGAIGKIIIENTANVNRRIAITEAIRPVLEREYRNRRIEARQIDKLRVIENCIAIGNQVQRDCSGRLKILYIGRDTYEKRPEIAFTVERELSANKNFDFLFIGRGLKEAARKAGSRVAVREIKEDAELAKIYQEAHIIILTSLFEGFPFVIMEAMSFGVVPITTAVGGIPLHVIDNENGFLVESGSEKKITKNIVSKLLELESSRSELQRTSIIAQEYALKNFSCRDFCSDYKKIIFE